MEYCKPAHTPIASGMKSQAIRPSPLFDAMVYRSLVGSKLYLTHTRPDIAFIGKLLNIFFAISKALLTWAL
jgi:hypothetical protein|nr:hypothetical protein Q903MT_gene1451 [Picea sitchensis]